MLKPFQLGSCKVNLRSLFEGLQDKCNCNNELTNIDCQLEKESDEHIFCKTTTSTSCRDSVFYFANAYRTAENANDPECYEKDPGYRGTQVAEASCKGVHKTQYNYEYPLLLK